MAVARGFDIVVAGGGIAGSCFAGVTLIGDAAGSVDPTQGHGTSLLMRDIRELSEALRDDRDWQRAIGAYAER